jgi:hypothetical protein
VWSPDTGLPDSLGIGQWPVFFGCILPSILRANFLSLTVKLASGGKSAAQLINLQHKKC